MDSMAMLLQLTFPLFLLLQLILPFSLSSPSQRHLLQSTSLPPQNLQTFPSTSIPVFTNPPPQLPHPIPQSPASTAGGCDAGKIAAAVVASAASSFVLSALIFLAFHRFAKRNRRKPTPPRVHNSAVADASGESANPMRSKSESTLRGTIVDENGLDILWRNLGDSAVLRCNLCNGVIRRGSREEEDEAPPEENRQRREWRSDNEIPLLPFGSINSSSRIFEHPISLNRNTSASGVGVAAVSCVTPTPPPSPPNKSQLPPPPGPPPPPPPPAPVINKGQAPPPPLPLRRRREAPPLVTPEASSKPTLTPAPDGGREPRRLKQLYWDKVTPVNAGHSVVWDRINNGSIKFDDDLMESLFGYFSANQNSPYLQSSESIASGAAAPAAISSQIHLLDSRKSQNIAIVLRTLSVSRQEILDSLLNGHELITDTFEKLSRIAPTTDEESLIVNFSGNPSKLVDADSFLFHLLRAIPSAFRRIAAMHFRHSLYRPEILHLKLSLQTLELACKELRTRGVFLKLLEAILKAGNRMNAGTSRGDAQAFDLTTLCKLSDVKSTDGNTTLLHFVVEEVVRSEGKHCAAVNRSLRRSASQDSASDFEQEASRLAREEREREYLMLGLPAVGGLSVEFANVKKAAGLDQNMLDGSCAALSTRVEEIQRFLGSFAEEDGGFVREMRGFAEAAAREIEAVKEEHGRVMEIVKRTMEYYQPGAAASRKAAQPLQLFVIVRDFLGMVDQACIDITRNMQKKKQRKTQPFLATVSRPPDLAAPFVAEEEKRITTRFPNLPPRFMSDNSVSSSDSD